MILPKALMSTNERSSFLQRSIAIDKSMRAEYDRKGGAEWARRHSAIAVAAKGDPEARWMLAAAYLRLGKAEEAAAAAREALALSSRDPRGLPADRLRFRRPESDR